MKLSAFLNRPITSILNNEMFKDKLVEILGNSSSTSTAPSPLANVMDHGAIGDGVADDTAAFAAAIATGKAVVVPFPSVEFKITGITLGDDQVMFGYGNKSKIKFLGTERCISVSNRSKVYNMWIQGSGKASGKTYETGVFCYAKIGWSLEDLYITDFGGIDAANGGGGIQVTTLSGTNSDGGTVKTCYLKNNNCGLNVADRAEYVTFTALTISDCNTGAKFQAGNITYQGGSIQGCGVGMKFVTGANDGHSNFTGVMVNHNTVNLSSVGITNGNSFSACKFYAGDVIFTSNTGLRFTNCDFSIGAMTLTTNVSILISGGRFPKGATAGAMVLTVVSGAAITEANNFDF